MMFKDILGREVIGKNGNRVGIVDDFVFTEKGKVTHLVVLPTGIVKALKPKLNIQFGDIDSIQDVVFLGVTEDEAKGTE